MNNDYKKLEYKTEEKSEAKMVEAIKMNYAIKLLLEYGKQQAE